MTKDQEREVKLLVRNIQAVHNDEQIVALCADLLNVQRDLLRAWLARLGDHGE